jgi:hypothetical protein
MEPLGGKRELRLHKNKVFPVSGPAVSLLALDKECRLDDLAWLADHATKVVGDDISRV